MNKESLKYYSILSLGILSALVLAVLFFKYLIPVVLPFLIAWCVAMATRSFSARLSRKSRIPKRIVRLTSSLFFAGAILGTIVFIIWRLLAAVWQFLVSFGEGNRLYELILSLSSADGSLLGITLPEELLVRINEAIDAILSSAMSYIATLVRSVAAAVPDILFFLLVLLISLIYVSFDLDRINAFILSVMPRKMQDTVIKIRLGIFTTARKYLRSYILLSFITYGVLLVGFLILGVKRAPATALLIAVLDVLPVIGVGTVLLPWGVLEIIMGNHFLGIGLIVLFVVNAALRQLFEPKLVGKSLGVHPVATIIMIYAGYSLFGIGGLLLVPIVSVIVLALLDKNHTAEVGEGSGRK